MSDPSRSSNTNNVYKFPDLQSNVDPEPGSVWANISLEELRVCLGGEERNIPHSGYHRCSISKSSDQAIDPATWTAISFDSELLDVGGLHDTVINNTRITIQMDGQYRFYYQVKTEVAKDKNGYQTRILQDGSTIVKGTCSIVFGSKDASFKCLNLVSPILELTAGEYFELQIHHDHSAAQDVIADNTFFGVQRLY